MFIIILVLAFIAFAELSSTEGNSDGCSGCLVACIVLPVLGLVIYLIYVYIILILCILLTIAIGLLIYHLREEICIAVKIFKDYIKNWNRKRKIKAMRQETKCPSCYIDVRIDTNICPFCNKKPEEWVQHHLRLKARKELQSNIFETKEKLMKKPISIEILIIRWLSVAVLYGAGLLYFIQNFWVYNGLFALATILTLIICKNCTEIAEDNKLKKHEYRLQQKEKARLLLLEELKVETEIAEKEAEMVEMRKRLEEIRNEQEQSVI